MVLRMGRNEAETDTPDGSGAKRETNGSDSDTDAEPDAEHLSDVPEGCGCVEVWEHLSEERDPDG